ncbi:MAG: OadG family protein [Paludibacteraceae bacterium]|nr:OadG family protein [Paludibacteraceae bacterium]
MAIILSVTSDTWIVTGLGFGIVLVLLFCLVYILQGFGWIMQKATAPKAPKPEKPSPLSAPTKQNTLKTQGTPSEPEKAAIAMALAKAGDEDIAAVAYALFLARDVKHDIPTAMISLHKHETAWNEKSVGMNNVGF